MPSSKTQTKTWRALVRDATELILNASDTGIQYLRERQSQSPMKRRKSPITKRRKSPITKRRKSPITKRRKSPITKRRNSKKT